MRRAAPAAALLLLTACAGNVPRRDAAPSRGYSAVLIGTRLLTPDGETRTGRIVIDLETKQEGPDAEIYRLPLGGDDAALFRVEPGSYGLAPTRDLMGSSEPLMTLRVEDHDYTIPFPRELMRPTYDAPPRKIVVVGVLEATVLRALPGQAPQARLRLDDSVATRRELVQRMIRATMDPNVPTARRDAAVAWIHALQAALVSVLAETERAPLYQRAP